ncbi:MAG: 7,8-didemethyl-8-hydroxy-5-deazariboflavin synthase subunit CofG [Leptolyngbyaceae bacterium]|nr:7,8-didemethyl-8-hydroxy-5-deazariboflavin synthase subunit CofG [Leptolyngbyaceae bacterium]
MMMPRQPDSKNTSSLFMFSTVVTYSPAYTLVPTYECFNRCSYCNFRVEPGTDVWMSVEQARDILKGLTGQGIREILILSGEVHPHSKRRTEWFRRIYALCELALEMGFLPHTNAGPLTFQEMEQLKQVNVSMGLMLEQVTPHLMKTVHRHAPSKEPDTRIQQLEWAGQLRIPFTTGLLVGIGETEADWADTLGAIAQLHRQWGHIQEVILQPHSPGSRQAEIGQPFQPHQMPQLVSLAREILPDDIALQIPPNLVLQPDILVACIRAGASDLGGISPKDEVNPDYPHLSARYLAEVLNPHGIEIVTRLPVYPHYESWLSPRLRATL